MQNPSSPDALAGFETGELVARHAQTRNLVVALQMTLPGSTLQAARLMSSLRGYRRELVRRGAWRVLSV